MASPPVPLHPHLSKLQDNYRYEVLLHLLQALQNLFVLELYKKMGTIGVLE